jgi:hypothetical protein
MNSPKTPKKNPSDALAQQLQQLNLLLTANALDDLLARASTGRWSPRQLLEEIARSEIQDLARRSLERRLVQANLGRFKPMADFDWNWPKKIDRPLTGRPAQDEVAASGEEAASNCLRKKNCCNEWNCKRSGYWSNFFTFSCALTSSPPWALQKSATLAASSRRLRSGVATSPTVR